LGYPFKSQYLRDHRPYNKHLLINALKRSFNPKKSKFFIDYQDDDCVGCTIKKRVAKEWRSTPFLCHPLFATDHINHCHPEAKT